MCQWLRIHPASWAGRAWLAVRPVLGWTVTVRHFPPDRGRMRRPSRETSAEDFDAIASSADVPEGQERPASDCTAKTSSAKTAGECLIVSRGLSTVPARSASPSRENRE